MSEAMRVHAINPAVLGKVSERLVGSLVRMRKMVSGKTVDVHRNGLSYRMVMKSKEKLQQAMDALEAEARVRNIRSKPEVRSLIAELARSINILTSAADVFQDDEMSKEIVLETSAKTRDQLKASQRVLAICFVPDGPNTTPAVKFGKLESAAKGKGATNSPYMNKMGLTDDKSNKIKALRQKQEDADEKALLTRNNLHKAKMPNIKTTKGDFLLLEMPVVAKFEHGIRAQELQSAGFTVKGSIDNLPIIENQLVVAVNLRQFESVDRNAEGKVKKSTPKRVAEMAENFALEIAKIVGQKLQVPYHMIGDKGVMHKESGGFLFFWLLPESELDTLLNIVKRGGKSLVVEDWGLAVS